MVTGRIARALGAHRVIAIDTCVLVYHFEDHERFGNLAHAIMERVVDGTNQAVLSTLALLELQVGPYAKGLDELADEYYDVLGNLPNFRWVPLTYAIADRGARLRAQYRIKTPDAIHLATAIESGASLFVTNDHDFPEIEGLAYLVLAP